MQNSSVAGTEWQGWSFHKKAVRFQTSVSSIASKALHFNTHIWTAVVIWKGRRESLKAWTWRVFPEQQQGHLPALAALWPLLGLWPLAPCLSGHARVTASALLEGLCTDAREHLGRVCRSSPRQKDLIEAVLCTRSSQGFQGHLFQSGQRAALFVFMRTELEKQEVFPMKAHLYHVKDTEEPFKRLFGIFAILIYL